MQIKKPMLAGTLKSFDDLDFSDGKYYLGTPKLDGRRVLRIKDGIVSRKFKPIPNPFVCEQLLACIPENADGEVCVGNTYAESGAITRLYGEPDFRFYWFDWVVVDPTDTYEQRIAKMKQYHTLTKADIGKTRLANIYSKRVIPLWPTKLSSVEEVKAFEEKCLADGFEGICLRIPGGPYKFGRSTAKQEWLLKYKQFDDSEAEILGFYELMLNKNEAKKDRLGHTERSTKQEGKIPANTLGGFHVKDVHNSVTFDIGGGNGMTQELRQKIWDNRDKWLGKIIKYKYFGYGMVDKPRHPVYMGIRDKDDM